MNLSTIDLQLLIHELNLRIDKLTLSDLNNLAEYVLQEFGARDKTTNSYEETRALYEWLSLMLATHLPNRVFTEACMKRDLSENMVTVRYSSPHLLGLINQVSETLIKSRESGGMRDTVELAFDRNHDIKGFEIFNKATS